MHKCDASDEECEEADEADDHRGNVDDLGECLVKAKGGIAHELTRAVSPDIVSSNIHIRPTIDFYVYVD